MGTKVASDRRRLWKTKRVFYCTPQVLDNDLRNGVVDAKRIVCVVVDECHRAQGDYAYTTVLKQLLSLHRHFRVLGLSATPGTDIEKVQSERKVYQRTQEKCCENPQGRERQGRNSGCMVYGRRSGQSAGGDS